MEFGKVTTEALDEINFDLPIVDFPKHLRPSKSIESKILAGLNQWGYKNWNGKLYPPKTKTTETLSLYSKQLKTVELNATHYNFFNQATIEKWKQQTSSDFIFCPKMHQSITHEGNIATRQKELNYFLQQVSYFEDQLGGILIQLSEYFAPSKSNALYSFLEQLPSGFDFFLEVRHPDWFSVDYHFNQLKEVLSINKIGWVITDTAGRRDLLHLQCTIPKTFIRFVGNSLHSSDYKRLNNWVSTLCQWQQQGLETCYFFVHQHNEDYAPELIQYFIQQLHKTGNTFLPIPQLIASNNSGQIKLFE